MKSISLLPTILDGKREYREYFEWYGDMVARNANGFPLTNNKNWSRCCEQHSSSCATRKAVRLTYSLDAQGRPPVNPEHWEFWPACDDALWAWRQVFRMAEVARIAGRQTVIRPRYETAPVFAQWSRIWPVYRAMSIPVFRPHPGNKFVIGQFNDLRLRCLAAVCKQRRYSYQNRLCNYVLGKQSYVIAAGELYTLADDSVDRSSQIDADDRFEDLRALNSGSIHLLVSSDEGLIGHRRFGTTGGFCPQDAEK